MRCLSIINHSEGEKGLDIERLMYLDYLCLNTKDIGGESSLHAPIPNRGVQIYSRKKLIMNGLKILASKELVEVNLSESGIYYKSNENTAKFLSYFESNYYKKLDSRTAWTVEKFKNSDNKALQRFIENNLHKWGSDLIEDSQNI